MLSLALPAPTLRVAGVTRLPWDVGEKRWDTRGLGERGSLLVDT